MLLGSVQHLDDHILAVRSPADVGQVAVVAEVGHVAPCGCPGGEVVYSEPDLFAFHAVHRILYVPEGSGPAGDVQEREVRHPAVVLAVECQPGSVRGPEYAT